MKNFPFRTHFSAEFRVILRFAKFFFFFLNNMEAFVILSYTEEKA